MANIFRIDRTNNKIELGTTGTTINIASHTASKILALDGSKNLEVVTIGSSLDYTRPTLNTVQDIRTSASPTFAGLTITGSSVLGLNSSVFQPAAGGDSTTFFQIKNAAGIQVVGVDTVNKRVIIGEGESNAPFEVKGLLPGDVGGKPSGLLHVTNADDSPFSNSVITGHNSYNTNTQLWYLGSTTGTDNNIAFINRQNAALSLWTNNTEALRIDSNGTLTLIGTARVIKHMQFTMELGRGQSAPAERFVEDPYVSFTYAIGDDSHISREVPEDMDFTVASIVKVHWYTTDAGANGDGDEVRWEVQWASRAPGEDLTTGDTTDNSGDIVCSAQNIIVETTVVTIPADSIASGDMLGLHIQRVALGTGNDPTGSSVHVLDVELEYTSNKLGKAT